MEKSKIFEEVMLRESSANKKVRLIVVDAQVDFVTGTLSNEDAQIAVPKIQQVINVVRNLNGKIIFTKDTHYNDSKNGTLAYSDSQEGHKLPVLHCIKGTPGHDIVSQIIVDSVDMVIEKKSFGYNHWSDIHFEADEVIFIVGFCTDICVVSNALAIKAEYPELPVYVIAECCAGVTPETHEAALTTMKSCQIEII